MCVWSLCVRGCVRACVESESGTCGRARGRGGECGGRVSRENLARRPESTPCTTVVVVRMDSRVAVMVDAWCRVNESLSWPLDVV